MESTAFITLRSVQLAAYTMRHDVSQAVAMSCGDVVALDWLRDEAVRCTATLQDVRSALGY